MDETRGKPGWGFMGGGGQAVVVLVFLFCLAIFLVFKFGKNTTSVVNQEAIKNNTENQFGNLSKEEILEKLKAESNSEIYNKYLDKIKDGFSQEVSTQYQTELEQKTALPEQIIFLTKPTIGNSYSEKAIYLNTFEALFASMRKRGVFSESAIFASQAGATTSPSVILPLSDYDKETLLRIATEYENWAQQILNLETPVVYEKKSLNFANDLLNAGYIIKKVVEEKDDQLYVMWIAKYTQTIFDILANRYVK
jgi:hypothetical protein